MYGMNFYEFFKQNSASAKTFDQAMTDLSGVVNVSILAAYNFSSIGKLVDVGGGNGKLLSSILEAYPTMTGVLFDQPDVIERTSYLLETIGVSNSLQLAKGDFFKAVPVVGKWLV
ncbi:MULTISPECIES: methyltransferase [Okeania]|uniref:methyltransferase n=1 Tax=Okeania TaxID=1458928 RepID=UPI0023D90C75|nr:MULTISPECIES: methyltransferase [Okeania]